MTESVKPRGTAANVAERAGTAVPFKDTQASVWLDGVRGLAAVLVLGEHWRNALFVDYPQLVAHRLLWLVPYLLTGAGRQMVVVFFVLSGYLVGGSVLKAVDAQRWEWRRYLVHRLVRLWVVLLPGLVLCAFWDHVGLWLRWAKDVRYIGLALSARVFFGNLAFLQSVRLPAYGTDSPLWSLSYEFWYYLLFPLGWLAVRGRSAIWMKLLYAALFVASAWFVGNAVLSMFPIWLLGALLARLPRPRLGAGWRWVAAGLSTLVVFFLAKYRGPGAMYGDYAVGLGTFLALWAALSAGQPADLKAVQVRVARGVARFSYTLYVAHMPLLVLLTSLAVGNGRWVPGPGTATRALAVLAAVLGYTYVVAWATEFHTDRVRRRVETWLGPVPNASEGLAAGVVLSNRIHSE